MGRESSQMVNLYCGYIHTFSVFPEIRLLLTKKQKTCLLKYYRFHTSATKAGILRKKSEPHTSSSTRQYTRLHSDCTH